MSRFVQMPLVSRGAQTGASRDIIIKDIPRPQSSSIEKKADMLHAVCYATAQVVDGKIYVFGGRTTQEQGGSTYVQIYDIATNAWTSGVDVPYSIDGAASFVDGRNVFVVGGDKSTPRMSRYNVDENRWHVEMSPSYAFSLAYSALHADKRRFYIAGGIGQSGSSIEKAAYYDIDKKSWVSLPDAPFKNSNGAGFIDSIDNCFFCYFGNSTKAGKYLLDSDAWVLNNSQSYIGAACVFVEGRLVKVGGEFLDHGTPRFTSNLISSYLPVNDFISTDRVTLLPHSVMGATAVWVEGYIYVCGGKVRNPSTLYADVYKYKPLYETQGFLCRGECEIEVDRRALVNGVYVEPGVAKRVSGTWSIVFPEGVRLARITPLSDDFEIFGTRG